jgi:hypothetical protein
MLPSTYNYDDDDEYQFSKSDILQITFNQHKRQSVSKQSVKRICCGLVDTCFVEYKVVFGFVHDNLTHNDIT